MYFKFSTIRGQRPKTDCNKPFRLNATQFDIAHCHLHMKLLVVMFGWWLLGALSFAFTLRWPGVLKTMPRVPTSALESDGSVGDKVSCMHAVHMKQLESQLVDAQQKYDVADGTLYLCILYINTGVPDFKLHFHKCLQCSNLWPTSG